MFNNIPVAHTHSQKHGMHLDGNLNFDKHIQEKMIRANKEICAIRRLFNILPRNALVTKYKLFPDLILIIVISSMTNLIMNISVIKLKESNTMLH